MKRNKSLITRMIPLLIIFVVLSTAVTSFVAARYIKNTDDVTNSFAPAASDDPTVEETSNDEWAVRVADKGYPVYVRAEIVVTWQNTADGTVYFSKPVAGENYDLTLLLSEANSATGWVEEQDGYYYYKTPVESGGATTALIKSCAQVGDAPVQGYALNVEIIAQTVQAVGHTDEDNPRGEIPAFKDAWGLS